MSSGRKYDGFAPGQYAIEAYGVGGFRFGDMSHKGSLLALPTGIHAFAPNSLKEVDLASLAPGVLLGHQTEPQLTTMEADPLRPEVKPMALNAGVIAVNV